VLRVQYICNVISANL